MEVHDVLAGIGVLIGLVGIVVVLLPGIALQVVAVGLWAFAESSAVGWVVFIAVLSMASATTVLKYLFPGRRLRSAGIPRWVLFTAVTVGIVGLFAIPVIGGPIGFVLTVYLFERARTGRERAWPSTITAVRAVLTSIGIELAGGFAITVVFIAGTLTT